jgi:flagellar biosynthesis GTPase FlhF
MAIHKAKDTSFKLLWDNNEIFVEFLRDFIPLELLKTVEPGDIEDVTTNYLSLDHDTKEADTVKRINLKGQPPLFVIALVEHQSEVDYRMPFRILYYMILIWEQYEREINKGTFKSTRKQFKYPPIIPIVFFDGKGTWTAETNFLKKVETYELFEKYIPTFEYELVDLNTYLIEDLVRFGDILSVIMLIDKLKAPDELRLLQSIPKDYMEQVSLNIPESLKKLLANVMRVFLERINVPSEEIAVVTEQIYEQRIDKMFACFDGYDVQETRRLAGEEVRQELEEKWQKERQEFEQKWQKAEAERQKADTERQKAEAERQKAEAEQQKAEAEQQKAEAEQQRLMQNLLKMGITPEQILQAQQIP